MNCILKCVVSTNTTKGKKQKQYQHRYIVIVNRATDDAVDIGTTFLRIAVTGVQAIVTDWMIESSVLYQTLESAA